MFPPCTQAYCCNLLIFNICCTEFRVEGLIGRALPIRIFLGNIKAHWQLEIEPGLCEPFCKSV